MANSCCTAPSVRAADVAQEAGPGRTVRAFGGRVRTPSPGSRLSIRWAVLLLTRPPYLRWAAVTLVVVAALAWDLSSRATEPFPFAAERIDSGTRITDELIEWRDVRSGSLEMPVLDDPRAAVDIEVGDPITPSVTEPASPVPPDWWSVPVELPPGVPDGAPVRLLLPSGRAVDGIVTTPATDEGFGASIGAVAVASEVLEEVAAASAAGLVLVLISPRG